MRLLNIAIGVLITLGVYAQDLSVDKIMEKVEKNGKVASSFSKIKQTIVTSTGNTRTLTMEAYSKGFGDKQLSVYTAPARVKGDKILMLNGGDDIWFYTPKTDRVRHLASNAKKQKVQGSDFSYQDMEQRDYKKDFKTTLLGSERIDDTDHYKIEAIPTETGPNYSKIIFWVDKNKFISTKAEFYEDEILLKTLIASNIEKTGDIWTPKKLVMINNQTNSKTIMEILEIKNNIEIEESRFTTNYLKRK